MRAGARDVRAQPVLFGAVLINTCLSFTLILSDFFLYVLRKRENYYYYRNPKNIKRYDLEVSGAA